MIWVLFLVHTHMLLSIAFASAPCKATPETWLQFFQPNIVYERQDINLVCHLHPCLLGSPGAGAIKLIQGPLMLQPDLISAVNAGIDWPKPATTASSTIPLDLQLCKGMCQQLMLAADFVGVIPHFPCTLLFLDLTREGRTKARSRACTLLGPLSTDYLSLSPINR